MSFTSKAGSHSRIVELQDFCFSDFHKDVYGYRPRGATWDFYVNLDLQTLNETVDFMLDKMNEDQKQEELDKEIALAEFKDMLKGAMKTTKSDWKTSIRFLMDADNESNLGYWLWDQNLSFAKQREIERKFYANN
jgi:hypothetical protein